MNNDIDTYLKLDFDRRQRCGFPEFIYGAGKTALQVVQAAERLVAAGEVALATRIDPAKAQMLAEAIPEGRYDEAARAWLWRPAGRPLRPVPPVLVVAAGTSDFAVAGEALITLEACDCPGELLMDVGVAGLHRLLGETGRLRRASALIVVAGLEGALPSVVAGLVPVPVIAVPTSVGYGCARRGETALFAMLSSCASGVAVVNIDNGFGAACAAARILWKPQEKGQE